MDPEACSFVEAGMSLRPIASPDANPAITRLGRLARLSEREVNALSFSLAAPRRILPHRDILVEVLIEDVNHRSLPQRGQRLVR